MSKHSSVVYIILESLEPSLLHQWMNEGLLPNLEMLFKQSVSSTVRNPDVRYSIALWPSFSAEVWPGRHNHYCYLQPVQNSYNVEQFHSEDLAVNSIWDMIANEGRRVAMIDVPHARLTRTSHTLQVSSWGEHVVRQPFTCWPHDFEEIVHRVAGADPVGSYDLYRQNSKDLLRLTEALVKRATLRADLALAALKQGPWNLFLLNFSEGHCAGHQLWALHDLERPQHQPEILVLFGQDSLLDVYRAIDRGLGRVLDALSEDVFLLVLGTTGMGPRYDAMSALDPLLCRLGGIEIPNAYGWMETLQTWWLQVPGAIRHPWRRVADLVYDMPRAQTRAAIRFYAVPTTDNAGGIRINVRGREPEGCVNPGTAYHELCEWLTQELLALKNVATEQPAVRRVLRGDQFFVGPFCDRFPDLVIEWNDEAPIPPVRSERSGLEPISKLLEEHRDAGELDKPEEVGGVVFPADQEPSFPLEPGKEPFDEPATFVST